MMTKKGGPGVRIFPAAKELGITYPWLLKAIERGDVKTVVFGDVRLIPHAEMLRLQTEWHEQNPAA